MLLWAQNHILLCVAGLLVAIAAVGAAILRYRDGMGLGEAVRRLWTGLLGKLARRRGVALAIASTLSSICAGAAMQYQVIWLGAVAAGFGFLIVLLGVVPHRYAVQELLALMLPAIFRSLHLVEATDRVTIHYLTSARREAYEQLTDYYPRGTPSRRGRQFTFSHGIVGRCFKTRHFHHYSVPAKSAFREAMIDDWGFTESELEKLTQDRRSFMAVPIGQEGGLAQAVLYLDSSDLARFDEVEFKKHKGTIEDLFLPQLSEVFREL